MPVFFLTFFLPIATSMFTQISMDGLDFIVTKQVRYEHELNH